jgi:hypothetical protein
MNVRLWRPVLEEIVKYTQGLEGETIIRDEFKKRRIPHFQVDLMFELDGKYCLAEVKHQEPFLPPPFEGHGLPLWQIDARLKFSEKTGIDAWLFVVDPFHESVFYQNLKELNEGHYFDTQGDHPRRIFPLTNFKSFAKVASRV